MKRILSTALVILLFAGASQAQTTDETRTHHGRGKGMMKELNLTDEQKAKLKSLHEAERKEMQSLNSDGKTAADRAARKQIHEKYRAQFESVLTEDQKAKMKTARDEGKVDMIDRGDRKERGAGFAQELNLNADQKTKLTALNQDFRTKLEGVRNNSSLSKDEKKAQLKTIAEAHRANLKTILTPEQMEKMKSMRRGHQKKDKSSNV